MKITVLTGPWFPVPAVRGGAMQKSWHGLAREMARAGHEVTVVARTFPGQPVTETIDGVSFLRTLGFAQGKHLALDLVKDLVYALNALPRLPAADILVTNDFWLPALASRVRRSAGAVVISAARFPKAQYRLYRRAERIVAISSAVRDAIGEQEPVLASRTVVIPLPVDLDRITPRRASPQRAAKRLLYVGRIHPEKGIELLLRAFARVADQFQQWRLTLVGPTTESEGGGGDDFAAAMQELSLGQRVDWRGPVWEPAALADVYASSDLFCYPSLAERGEAFGVAALEAMAAGVPPVVSDLGCFRDFVSDGRNGWVFDHRGPEAEAALTEVLARVMGDVARRAAAGGEARKEAERFSFGAVAKEYLAEFERILPVAVQR